MFFKAAKVMIVVVFLMLFVSENSLAKDSKGIESSLKIFWPKMQSFSKDTLLISDKNISKLKGKLSGDFKDRVLRYFSVEGKKISEFAGVEKRKVLGFAVLVSRRVRTKKETLLIAISPQGVLQGVEVLAFWEPAEYHPSKTWLKQFLGKTKSDRIMNKRDIYNITGATLSASVTARAAKNILLVFNEVMKL